MGRCKSNILAFLFLIFVVPISFAFSDSSSLICGTWVKFNRITIETFCEYNTKKIALNKYLSRML